jgi:hypothetical protein
MFRYFQQIENNASLLIKSAGNAWVALLTENARFISDSIPHKHERIAFKPSDTGVRAQI